MMKLLRCNTPQSLQASLVSAHVGIIGGRESVSNGAMKPLWTKRMRSVALPHQPKSSNIGHRL